MGKRIKVVTKCGETSYHDFDQDVDTVEIIEEKITQGKYIRMESGCFFARVMTGPYQFEDPHPGRPNQGYINLNDEQGNTIAVFMTSHIKGFKGVGG